MTTSTRPPPSVTVSLNRRLFAITAILALVVLTAFSYKVTQIFDRLSAIESEVEDISDTVSDIDSEISDHASEIDDLRSEVDDLQSER